MTLEDNYQSTKLLQGEGARGHTPYPAGGVFAAILGCSFLWTVILGHSPSVTLCFRLITRNTRQIIHFNSVQIYYKFLYGDTEQSYVLKYIMNDAGVRRANGSVSSSNILFTTMPCFAGPADVCLPGSPHCIDQLLQGCLTHSLLCSALHAHPWFMSDILKTP